MAGVGTVRKKVMDRQVFGAGQIIFREGKPGGNAFVVQEGQVEIYKEVEGREVVLGRVEPGGLFGEMALIDDKPRMASARAGTRTVLIAISRGQLDRKLERTDGFVRAVLRILMGNYRQMARRLVLLESRLKEHGLSVE